LTKNNVIAYLSDFKIVLLHFLHRWFSTNFFTRKFYFTRWT